MAITIIGAGMAGLLAANMLKHHDPIVIEQQSSLPNNHSAVLRFRTSQVGDVLNIPFKPVKMIKDVLPWRNPVADALAYSFKNGGSYRSDRSIISRFVVDDRFIAPLDLIPRMAERLTKPIRFDQSFDPWQHQGPFISTIPMPNLMKLLEYSSIPEFHYISGVNIWAKVRHCDAYVSLYVPNPELPFSRISLMGGEMIVECSGNDIAAPVAHIAADIAADLLGFDEMDIYDFRIIKQQYAKIQPIDNDVRKQFIWWATDKHNIYSLGRYATWRPGLQLDDLVQDIRLIDRWLLRNDKYDMAQHRR